MGLPISTCPNLHCGTAQLGSLLISLIGPQKRIKLKSGLGDFLDTLPFSRFTDLFLANPTQELHHE